MGRLVSVLILLLGIPFMFQAARLIWPDSLGRQAAATAIYALWPQYLFNGSMVSNDGATPVVGAIITWLLLKLALRQPSFKLGAVCLLVIVLGTTLKLNLITLMIPLILIVALRLPLRLIALMTVLAATAILLLIIVLQSLPAVLLPFLKTDREGASALVALWRQLTDKGQVALIFEALRYGFESSFGVFGWGNLPLPQWIQALWSGGAVLAVAGSLSAIARRRRLTRLLILLLAILAAPIAGGLALCLFYRTPYLLVGRYLLPALSAVSLLLVIGWSALGRERLSTWCAVGGLATLGLMIPWHFLAPKYLPPLRIAEPTIPNYAPRALAPDVQLLGYTVSPMQARPDDKLYVAVYWKAVQPIRENYTVRVEVLGPDEVLWAAGYLPRQRHLSDLGLDSQRGVP